MLAEAGVDGRAVARAAGVDPDAFGDAAHTISFTDMGRYLAQCVKATQDETFALRLGLDEGARALYALGYMAEHSVNVRSALATLGNHIHHFGGELSIGQGQEIAWIDYSFMYSAIEGSGLISEGGIGIGASFLRQLCGRSWNLVEVRISRAEPAQPSRWRQCLRAPVVFGTESNVLLFAAHWLDHPIERADPDLRRILEDRVAELELRRPADFPAHVRSAIRACLLHGEVSAVLVARRLATSPRTLSRRLQACQTGFDRLLDQTRFETACHLLENSDATLTQVAGMLGYAHSSALSRAFRRWTGKTPRQWRTVKREDR